MSQRNETVVLFLALIITLGIVGSIVSWLTSNSGIVDLFPTTEADSGDLNPGKLTNQSVSNRLSFGERILMPGVGASTKQLGIEAIAAGENDKAIANFQAALQVNPNDPESLIYLNNARIGSTKSYTIAASVPIGTAPDAALEILRGVAQAQNEINNSGGIRGIPLKVAIANDGNNPEIAKQIASALVNNAEILGVVGSYASDVTLAAGTIYHSGKLVAITPTSTSVKLSGFSPYIFRTVPSDYVAARGLANYMLTKLRQQNAAVFFDSGSNYSQSLKSEFVTAVALGGGQVSSEFDLSDPSFSAARSVNQAIAQKVQVLMLAASTNTLDKALQVVQVSRKRLSLLGGDDVYTSKTLEVGEEAAVDMVVAVPWDIDGEPKTDFPRLSRQLWGGDVNWRTALAYDATQALIVAIERNPTRTGVQNALSASDYSTTGASGTIRFLPSGDRNGTIHLVKVVPSSRFNSGYDFVPVPQ